jgi:hypothetical protein
LAEGEEGVELSELVRGSDEACFPEHYSTIERPKLALQRCYEHGEPSAIDAEHVEVNLVLDKVYGVNVKDMTSTPR